MKKDEFVKLALMGLASGMLASNAIDALQNSPTASNMLASGCGGKGKCGGAIANGCGGKGKCSGTIAAGCGGKNGCGGAIASGCGGKNGCGGAIAEKDTQAPLTAPAPIPKDAPNKKDYNPNDQNIGYHLYTDEELRLELNGNALKSYEKMSPEAKALVRTVASASCNGTNECKGLNACKTEKNDCAGKGQCKGQGKCAIADKNLVVKLVETKLEAKRQNLTK